MKPVNFGAVWRNRALLVSLPCWAIFIPLTYYGWPDRVQTLWPLWAQITFFAVYLVVFNGAVLGLAAAFWLHIEARGFARLQNAHVSGEVLVRWRLSPADWEGFKALSARAGVPAPVEPVPPEGVECHASTDSAQAGPMFLNVRDLGIVSHVTYLGGSPGAIRIDAIAAAGATVQRLVRHTMIVPVGGDHRAARFLHAAWLWRHGLIGSSAGRSSARRLLAWALAALLLGVGLLAWPIWQFGLTEAFGMSGGQQWTGGLIILGAILIPVGLALSVRFSADWIRQARASRGAPIAGWRVEPDAWRVFMEAEAAANAKPKANYNLIEPAALAPPVDIEADGDTLKIGGKLIDVRALAAKGVKSVVWIDGLYPAIELTGVYHARQGAFSRLSKPSGDSGDFVLRFPVAVGAEDAGRRVVEDWNRRFTAAG